jgi:endonuclease YncB( thermonuclease family)
VSSVRAAIGKYRGTADTNEAFHGGKHECIRLGGIDFSEKGQAYGNNAKHAACELVFGKEVTVQTHGKDKYKRTIWRRDSAKWHESQSGTRQAGLVLVVSKVCARRYGAGRAREPSARGEERVMDDPIPM